MAPLPVSLSRISLLTAVSAALLAGGTKPMTPLDVLHFKTAAAGTLSRDGKAFAYTVSALDWKEGKRYTDIWVTDTATGHSRQFTFTPAKNETAPAFSPDGAWLAFLSDREGAATQVYLLPMSGGEARKISTVAGGGVASFAFSEDGKWIAMLGGRAEARQIQIYDMAGESAEAAGPRHATGVTAFAWGPESDRLYFAAPDTLSEEERKRTELKFDVRRVDQPRPPVHLWELELAGKKERRLTEGNELTVREFRVAKAGGWITVLGGSTDRYDNDVASRKREAWLVHAPTGKVERLTDNAVSESLPIVSPDGKWVAMTAPDGFTYFRRSRIYLRSTEPGAARTWRSVLAAGWDYDPADLNWQGDSQGLTFEAGTGASTRSYSVKLADGSVPVALTSEGLNVNVTYHQPTGQYFLTSQDAEHPLDYYLAASASDLGNRSAWKRLSETNPGAADFALGKTETIRWKSTDGSMVEGLLVYPVGYEKGRRYPLVTQIHGGPAAATTTQFANSYGRYDHVYAANGYALLHPNYRGSSNYGEKFKTAIVGNYFQQGFEDIMAGVDHVIAMGVADADKLGMMGWSAGGHWSNWTLTHTNRFKAISSGAGAMNWVSMYAQNDSQANRENYFNGTPYDNFDHWMAMSPIKYIKNARTPTLIHVGDDDPRVPRPQSEELHMALKKLGVPTEFLVYPRMGHGLTEPRYQMVKMVAEFNWFEKWIKGKDKWLDWQEILDTVPGRVSAAAEK